MSDVTASGDIFIDTLLKTIGSDLYVRTTGDVTDINWGGGTNTGESMNLLITLSDGSKIWNTFESVNNQFQVFFYSS